MISVRDGNLRDKVGTLSPPRPQFIFEVRNFPESRLENLRLIERLGLGIFELANRLEHQLGNFGNFGGAPERISERCRHRYWVAIIGADGKKSNHRLVV